MCSVGVWWGDKSMFWARQPAGEEIHTPRNGRTPNNSRTGTTATVSRAHRPYREGMYKTGTCGEAGQSSSGSLAGAVPQKHEKRGNHMLHQGCGTTGSKAPSIVLTMCICDFGDVHMRRKVGQSCHVPRGRYCAEHACALLAGKAPSVNVTFGRGKVRCR